MEKRVPVDFFLRFSENQKRLFVEKILQNSLKFVCIRRQISTTLAAHRLRGASQPPKSRRIYSRRMDPQRTDYAAHKLHGAQTTQRIA